MDVLFKRDLTSTRTHVHASVVMLPSNQSFHRLIEAFGMGVADCEVGQ